MTPLVPGSHTNCVKITRHNGLPEPLKTSERSADRYKYRYIGRQQHIQSSTSQTFVSAYRHVGTQENTENHAGLYTKTVATDEIAQLSKQRSIEDHRE